MGITKEDCRLLFHSKNLGVSFSETLTLGRQRLYAQKEDIQQFIEIYENHEKNFDKNNFTDDYSEALFEILGAKRISSLDYSNYEGASIVHDLNTALPDEYKNSFSVVIDSGTLEHVFNFPVAIRSCMDILKLGGHFIGITPTNNFMGHGFYQFSPELYFRVFSPENGFALKNIFVRLAEDDTEWYEVSDPLNVKSRVQVVNDKPLFLMVIAEKIKNVEVFNAVPQQSDYSAAWDIHEYRNKENIHAIKSLKYFSRSFVKRKVKEIFSSRLPKKKLHMETLGYVNSKHFKKANI